MKILVIAPDLPGLPHRAAEIQQLLAAHPGTRPLVGNVTMRSVVMALQQPTDIVWFISHSSAAGIQLSDGLLTAGDLAPLVRSADLIVLNTCSSLATAAAVNEETRVDTIAAINDVEDRSAFRFGVSFLRNLAQGRAFRQAFDASISAADSNYVYLEGVRVKRMDGDLTKAMYELKVEIVMLTQRVSTLETSLNRIPTAPPNEAVLRLIFFSLLALCLLVGYAIYTYAG